MLEDCGGYNSRLSDVRPIYGDNSEISFQAQEKPDAPVTEKFQPSSLFLLGALDLNRILCP